MIQNIIKNYLVINEIGVINVYEATVNITSWLENLRTSKEN